MPDFDEHAAENGKQEWRVTDPDGPGMTGTCPATRAMTDATFGRIISRLLPEEGGDRDG